MTARRDLYPVAIIQDRYCGTYAGGTWIAIAEANNPVSFGPDDLYESVTSRVQFCMEGGAAR